MTVSPGDPIRMRARDWNLVADRANNTRIDTVKTGNNSVNRNTVLIKNKTDEILKKYMPVMLGDLNVKLDQNNKVASPQELDNRMIFDAGLINTDYSIERKEYIDYYPAVPEESSETRYTYDYPLVTYDGYKYFKIAISQQDIEPLDTGTATISGASYLWANKKYYDKENEVETNSIKYIPPSGFAGSDTPVWFELGYRPYYGVLHEKQYAQSINIGEWQKLTIDGYIDPDEYIQIYNKYLVSSMPIFQLIDKTDNFAIINDIECELILVRFMDAFAEDDIKIFREQI